MLSPCMAEEASARRPQFVVSKYEPSVFDFYWSAIRNAFDNAGWVEINALKPLP